MARNCVFGNPLDAILASPIPDGTVKSTPMTRRATNAKVGEQIGRRLSQLRTAQGWTQARLAEALHLPPSSVSRIENGQRAISIEQLLRAAQALGVAPAEILGGSVPKRSVAPTEESALLTSFGRLDARRRRLVLSLAQELAATSGTEAPEDDR